MEVPGSRGAEDLRGNRAADRDNGGVTLEDISAPGEEHRAGGVSQATGRQRGAQ